MSFIGIARSRRSCRAFSSEPIGPEEKALILEAGRLAPSSRNRRPVTLVPVDDVPTIRALAGCRDSNPALESCVFAIAVTADPSRADTWIEDASIASIMMQMEAEDLSLGSCWIQVRMRDRAGESSEGIVRGILGIPPSAAVLSIIAVGRRP